MIGNTPMIEIKYTYKNQIRKIYTKLEFYNITGSIKDRMVQYCIQKNIENGNIKEGDALIEATSGNTGISLAAMGARLQHPVYIFMPDFVSKERIELIKSFGANVTLVSKEEGGYDTCIRLADAFKQEYGGFRLDQFKHPYNITAHYQGTATEIVKQLPLIDGFASGIGTGGTLMGCALKIKENNENAVIAAIEPSTMTLLSVPKVIGDHQIEGIADGFMPALVDTELINKVILIQDIEAIAIAQKLAKELGLGVGISSGANCLGGILLEEAIGGTICTVFPDDNKKYLSTKLLEEQELGEESIVSQIRFLSYEIM
ncbi:MAG: cysteine synthase family protein [Bacilli bacterium]|nr:cysteine synthase family protein [Bacilli bacterium]